MLKNYELKDTFIKCFVNYGGKNMYLKKVDIKEFKKVIFKEYKKIFPRLERNFYMTLRKSYNHNKTDFIEIIAEEQLVGFIITNFI